MEINTIKFNDTRTVQRPGLDDLIFKEGESYKLPLASCDRWIRRGAASLVGQGKAKTKAPAKED